MKFILFSFLFTSFLFSSCSEVKRKKNKQKDAIHKEFIFDMTHSFSENEREMSFPNWFDEDYIQKKNIKSIRRKLFPSSHHNNPDELNPKEKKTYDFDTDGSLKRVNITQFYEYITVADINFEYKTLKDDHGYSPVRLVFEKNENNSEAIDQFFIYDKIDYQKNYLVYQNTKTGDYRFYMLRKEYWGTLSVDSIFDPNPQDVIIFGSPISPQKKYFVENKVNESDVVLTHYSPKGFPIEIKSEKFPFQYKRTIIYDKTGNCSGFIDSTFSNNEFLTRRNSSFVFKDGLPIELIHESKSNNKLFIQVETFDYEFFH